MRGLMAVLSDATMSVRQERLLKQNEAWFNAILTGFTSDAVLGQPYSIFYPDDATTPDRLHDRLVEAGENGWSLDDGWRIKADDSRFWGSASPIAARFLKRPKSNWSAGNAHRGPCH